MKVTVVAYHHGKVLFQGEHESPLMLKQALYVGEDVYRVAQQHRSAGQQIVNVERVNHGKETIGG